MEMTEDDRPPERLWLDDEGLSDHFKKVREKYSNGSSNTEQVPDLEQNEITRELRRR